MTILFDEINADRRTVLIFNGKSGI